MDEILLKIEHLQQAFGTTKAVDDVSFSVHKGEIFGIVGESGSGKTTLGRSLLGLYPATGGQIYFRGKPLTVGRHRKPEPKMQMIFQDPMASLDPRMTVREIIAEGLVIRGERKNLEERVLQMLERVGLRREHADRYPHEFSGGQRQRIGIARAIIMEPELLIADEPISALDMSVQAQVINLLQDLRQELGLSILFIAHDLSVVKYFCDRIGVMHLGKLVELASSEELFARPLHPYTRALLSAIPLPDPRLERRRTRLFYEQTGEIPGRQLLQALPEHWVWGTQEEIRGFLAQ